MAGLASVTIVGNIGRDAETRQVGEQTVASFTVAVNTRKGREDVTTWYRVSAWGRLASQKLVEILTKGKTVAIMGSLHQSEYTKDGVTRTTLEVNANDIQLVGPKGDGGSGGGGGRDSSGDFDDNGSLPF